MKSEKLFKLLVDVVFIFQILGVSAFVIVIPFSSMLSINMQNEPLQDWSFTHWFIFVLSALSYIYFVISMFNLRKVSKQIIHKKYFSNELVLNLKKVGKTLIVSGLLMLLISFIKFLSLLFKQYLQLVYSTDLIFSFFILTIGLFFMIQSKIILNASVIKQENDLTV